MAQSNVFQNELIVANSDRTLQILDVESGVVLSQTAANSFAHEKAITAVHSPGTEFAQNNDGFNHVFLTASEDGFIKMWDRRQGVAGPVAAQVTSAASGFGQKPFFCCTTNGS